MGIYEGFAQFFAKGNYPAYSQRMAEALPSLLQELGSRPQDILDIACGEGSFAVAMAKQGFRVTGVDQSAAMLKFATAKAKREGVRVGFHQHDMRKLNFGQQFDLVTCWFDSLNYLLDVKDVRATFDGVARALRPRGLFIFDVNTIYRLNLLARRYACVVERETSDVFQVHRHSYDAERNIATFHIVDFAREKSHWNRVEEVHQERGYAPEELRACLRDAQLQERACWDKLLERHPPTPKSRRLYFVAQK
jgi:2-polyprenyl-3-methyl-5-hydroxy-6-metoxy-1,4-benzoquinol methylase